MKLNKSYIALLVIFSSVLLLFTGCKKDNNNGNAEKYSVGGTVEGLGESGLVLQNNNDDDLAISDNGSFTFPKKLEDSTQYSVTVSEYPTGQACYVENGIGMIDGANITNVRVVCETPAVNGSCEDGSITYDHHFSND